MDMLRDALTAAGRKKAAIGHFNIGDLAMLKAVTAAGRGLGLPVLLGASEGERAFIGVRQIAALVRSMRDEDGQAIFLNADHTHSLALAEEAARSGFDMVGFDGSTQPPEENMRKTRQVVEALKSINPSVIVEGELGYIGTGSEIHDKAPDKLVLTTAAEARQFIAETEVDVFAPAVGNMHGLLKSMISGQQQKRLDIGRIAEIKAATGRFLTLHGGSGTNDDDFKRAIKAGMTIVHISTELRLAWRRGIDTALQRQPDEVVPYRLYGKALAAMEETARRRLTLFNSA